MSDIQADAPLSIDAATALLGAEPEQQEEAAEGAQESAAEAPPEEQPAAAEEGEAEATETEEGTEAEQEESEEGDEPEQPAIEPPPSWNAEDREVFAHLPRDAQEVLVRREAERDRALNRTQQQLAEERKRVVAEGQGLQSLVERVQSAVETAEAAFKRPIPDLTNAQGEPMTWEQVDWDAWYESDPQSAAVWEARYNRERQKLEQAKTAHQQAQEQAQRQQFTAFVEERNTRLAEIAPDLARDESKREELSQYLQREGVPAQQIIGLTAEGMAIAHKAMLYDRAQAAMKAPKPKPSTPPPPPSKPVKPASSAPASPKQHQASVAKNRFAQTGGIDDAVALLNLRG